jgi:hypothetical protein
MNDERRATILWQKSKYYLRNLNLFPSIPPTTDENELRTQRISTRLFIIIFSISLVILLLYTSLIKVTKTVSVEAPSFAQYAHLNSTYSQTLACPCSKISINYGKFLHVKYTLHQICTSIFLDKSWIDYLTKQIKDTIMSRDFRVTSPSMFQALKTFCDLINQTISDSLTQFYLNQYISASIIPQKLFESEIKSLIDKFRSSLRERFLLSLSMIRDINQANALFTGRGTNYRLLLTLDRVHIYIREIGYNNCNCALSSTCTSESGIYNHSNNTVLFNVPGFYIGCYVVESLLQSTLECFYDQRCIDKLKSYLSPSSSVNVIALDESLSNVSSKDSTIQELVDNLMIEQWNVSSIFENYYNECQPIECTYTFEANNDVIYIVTTLFGIVGGLTTVLRLLLPRLLNVIVYCIRKQRTRVVPEMLDVEI